MNFETNQNRLYKIELTDAFPFTCNNCGSCCTQMEIKLTPYDILSMAFGLNISTGNLIEKEILFLTSKEQKLTIPILKGVKKNRCSFRLGDKCLIHPYRSLNCRLFPLARKKDNYYYQPMNYCKGSLESSNDYLLEQYLTDSKIQEYGYYKDGYLKILENYQECLEKKPVPDLDQLFLHILYDFDSVYTEALDTSELSIKEKGQLQLFMADYFLTNYYDPGFSMDTIDWDGFFEKGGTYINGNFRR